ncbi:MAG: DUF983 domain-containing protein [Planctomycetota bacterium]|nr:DUF983 domain-containing protein [Planctomycetota bacterium]
MFRKWLIMNEDCPECGCHFEREEGFFLGSIYVNYTFTALTMTILYMIAYFLKWADNKTLLGLALVYVVIVPAIIHPFARSLWAGFDQICDPRKKDH